MKQGNCSALGHPLAFCLKHGVFPDRSFMFGSGTVATFVGKCQTSCPICFEPCELLPGTYEVEDDRLDLLLDPTISPEALNALIAIALRLKRREITPPKAKELAEKISPRLGGLFDVANWSDTARSHLYAGIIGAAAILAAARMNTPTIVVQPVVERVIERTVTAPPPNKKRPLPGLPGGRPLATKPKKRPQELQ